MGAVVAILGAIDVPLVFMASRWFRGIHPASPSMEPRMRVVLLLNVFAMSVFFALLLVWRRNRLLHAGFFAKRSPQRMTHERAGRFLAASCRRLARRAAAKRQRPRHGGQPLRSTAAGVPNGGRAADLIDGKFAPFRIAKSDAQGRYRFDHLPVGADFKYLLGANCNDVLYPGPRLQLFDKLPDATATLAVYDAIAEPSPLRLARFCATIAVEAGLLRVTESLEIDNPSKRTYIGKPHGKAPATTLSLAIPKEFGGSRSTRSFSGGGLPWSTGGFPRAFPGRRGRRRSSTPTSCPTSRRGGFGSVRSTCPVPTLKSASTQPPPAM